MHKALSVWEDDPANNKGTSGLPNYRPVFNIACLMAVMRYVRCVTWFEWTWIYRNCRRSTIVFTDVLMPFWCQAIYNHHNGIAWAVRFTHNGHHHCKKTSPPGIKNWLVVDLPTSLQHCFIWLCNVIGVYHATVISFNNWRVGMVVTDGLASADLQPPWWRRPIGSSQDRMQGWPNASTGNEAWPSVFGIMLH